MSNKIPIHFMPQPGLSVPQGVAASSPQVPTATPAAPTQPKQEQLYSQLRLEQL